MNLKTLEIMGIGGVLFLQACSGATPYVPKSQYDRDIQAEVEARKALEKRNTELEAENRMNRVNKTAEQMYEDAINELRQALKELGPGIEITKEGVIQLSGTKEEDEIFFALGRAEIQPKGQKILARLAKKLKEAAKENFMIRIVGHTDDRVVKRAQERYKIETNLELGILRAQAVMREFHKAGISEKNMFVESHGQNTPQVPNTSKENRQKNRRVEIYLLKKK